MSHAAATLMFVGVLTGRTAVASAPAERSESQASTRWLLAPASTHAVRGVVKSVSAGRLVIARSGKGTHELTFVLAPSTLHGGPLVVGTTVSVRYRTEGEALVATAVTTQTEARSHPSAPVVR